MKIYIVHPNHDYEVEEIFTSRELAEEHLANLDDSEHYYIEERELLDQVPAGGGNRYDRFERDNEKRNQNNNRS
jgi:hypothetical protein